PATECPAWWWTATTSSRSTKPPETRWSAPVRAKGQPSWSARPIGCGRTPTPTTTAATARPKRSSTGAGATRSVGWSATCWSTVSSAPRRSPPSAPMSAPWWTKRPRLPTARPAHPSNRSTTISTDRGSTMREITFIEAIREALADEMAADESVIVLGEDVAVKGGVFLATDGLLQRYGEKRVIDTPIAEASIVGLAIGASLHG